MEKQTNNEGLASATGKEKQEQNETDLELSQKAEPEPESQQNGGEIDEIKYLTGFKLWIVVASVAMAGFLVLLDTMVIGTAIPIITNKFHSLPDFGWYASAYQFGRAAPQPLTGKVYTHFKIKWSFLVSFAIFELGSVLCSAANSSVMFIIGRAICSMVFRYTRYYANQ